MTNCISRTQSIQVNGVNIQQDLQASRRTCLNFSMLCVKCAFANDDHYSRKSKAPTPLALTPFDCCSLSLQPFEHPVCSRNEDGTGTVFDLVNIIPWLKYTLFFFLHDDIGYLILEVRHHDNKHPITGVKIDPSSLVKLNYARDPKGEMHDPVSFKRFSEHSHIVAIATTGNVFLYESIKGNRDLVADVDFTKYVSQVSRLSLS